MNMFISDLRGPLSTPDTYFCWLYQNLRAIKSPKISVSFRQALILYDVVYCELYETQGY
jgi:hypothetical protein